MGRVQVSGMDSADAVVVVSGREEEESGMRERPESGGEVFTTSVTILGSAKSCRADLF